MIARSAVGQRVVGEDGPLLVSYWTLFLEAEFRAPGWTVVASRPKRSALSVLDSFRSWFLPAAGIMVTITIWLTLVQVRRRLGPLERLRDATAKGGQGRFLHTAGAGDPGRIRTAGGIVQQYDGPARPAVHRTEHAGRGRPSDPVECGDRGRDRTITRISGQLARLRHGAGGVVRTERRGIGGVSSTKRTAL